VSSIRLVQALRSAGASPHDVFEQAKSALEARAAELEAKGGSLARLHKSQICYTNGAQRRHEWMIELGRLEEKRRKLESQLGEVGYSDSTVSREGLIALRRTMYFSAHEVKQRIHDKARGHVSNRKGFIKVEDSLERTKKELLQILSEALASCNQGMYDLKILAHDIEGDVLDLLRESVIGLIGEYRGIECFSSADAIHTNILALPSALDNPAVPEDVRQGILSRIAAVDEQYSTLLKRAYEGINVGMSSGRRNTCDECEWDDEEDFLFEKVLCEGSAMQLSRSEVSARLLDIFPGRSRKDVAEHFEFMENMRTMKQHYSSSRAAWIKARKEAVDWADTTIQTVECEIFGRLCKVIEKFRRESERENRLLQRDAATATKWIAMRDAEIYRSESFAEEEATQRENRIRHESEQEAKHAALKAYRDGLASLEIELRLKGEYENIAAAAHQMRVAEYNAERVRHRAEVLRNLTAEREKERAEAEAQREHLEFKLEMLRQTVRPENARDPSRHLAPTAATANRQGMLGNGCVSLIGEQVAASQIVHGYTHENLMRDPRFRAQEAMHAAGMGGTRAAAEIMVQMSKPSPHNISFVKF